MRVLIGLLLALALGSFARAGVSPTTADPQAMLAVRAENQPLVDEAAKVYAKARDMVADLKSKQDQKQYAAIRGEVVGEAFVLVQRLSRLAGRLKATVEPAGVDLELRAIDWNRELGQLILEMKQIPAVREGLARTFATKLAPLSTKRQQQIPTLERLCKSNQWETAESELYEILDELETLACWYGTAERELALGPFDPAKRTINETLFVQRNEAWKLKVDNLRVNPGLTLDAWLQQSMAVGVSVAQAGTTSLDGKQLKGPEAFAHLARQLPMVQQSAMRRLAVEWVRERLHSRSFPEAGALLSVATEKTPEVLKRLAALIEADAARASESEVTALHQAYLNEAANISSFFPAGEVNNALQPALDKLAAKDPSLAAQVVAYQHATGDLMRWRRRIAEYQATSRSKEFPPLRAKLLQVCLAEGKFSSILGQAHEFHGAALLRPAPIIMAELTKAVGANVQVDDALANDAGTHAVTRYENRLNALLPNAKQALAGYLPLLEYDLLVNPALPPLSLAAASALAKARRGDLESAGGVVKQVGLIGLVPRWLESSSDDVGALRMGPLPAHVILDHNPTGQLCIECEVDPAWVQHELYFVPLR